MHVCMFVGGRACVRACVCVLACASVRVCARVRACEKKIMQQQPQQPQHRAASAQTIITLCHCHHDPTRIRRRTIQVKCEMRNAECENIAEPYKTLERAANNNLTYGENTSYAILHNAQVKLLGKN